jgi:hypothetical protein
MVDHTQLPASLQFAAVAPLGPLPATPIVVTSQRVEPLASHLQLEEALARAANAADAEIVDDAPLVANPANLGPMLRSLCLEI